MDTKDFRMSANRLYDFDPKFTVLLGDNFYDSGVSSLDDPLWGLFTHIQGTAPVFYAVLGNHDYVSPVDVQSAYSYINPKWQMPARYFYRIMDLGNGVMLCAIFLDSYFLEKYQINWLRMALRSPDCQNQNSYRFVFTHYPIHTVGLFVKDDRVKALRNEIKPLLEEYRVHALVSGHEHEMSVFHQNGIQYIISGSFSDKYQQMIVKGQDPHLTFRDVETPGFVVFDSTNSGTISYRFIDSYSGATVYSDTIKRDGNWTVTSGTYTYWSIHVLVCLLVGLL
jgi:tartrate-resistant acid phosphatase type 5